MEWIVIVVLVALSLSQIYAGIQIIRKREYVGQRRISLFKTEPVIFKENAAVILGYSHIAGFSLLLVGLILIGSFRLAGWESGSQGVIVFTCIIPCLVLLFLGQVIAYWARYY